MTRKIPEEIREEIKRLREKGWFYRRIAEAVGVSYEAARRIALDVPWRTPPKKKPLKDHMLIRQRIGVLARAGDSPEKIAKLLDVPLSDAMYWGRVGNPTSPIFPTRAEMEQAKREIFEGYRDLMGNWHDPKNPREDHEPPVTIPEMSERDFGLTPIPETWG